MAPDALDGYFVVGAGAGAGAEADLGGLPGPRLELVFFAFFRREPGFGPGGANCQEGVCRCAYLVDAPPTY